MYKTKFLLGSLLMLPFFALAQRIAEEALLQKMCAEFQKNKRAEPQLREQRMLQKHLLPYLLTVPKTEIDSVSDRLYIRLHKTCVPYRQYLLEKSGTGNWKVVEKMPQSHITREDFVSFQQQTHFFYFESSSMDKTYVSKTGEHWVETFPDKTYSKTKIRYLPPYSYTLTFVESTNADRKAFSNPGDLYHYTLLEKQADFYLVAAQIVGQKEILLFRLFYAQQQ